MPPETNLEIPFYAPLKHPDHTRPSGDRTMARGLIRALEARPGTQVFVASKLSSRNGTGEAKLSADIKAAAEPEIRRLISIGLAQNWPFWVTYHNYYKAPDLIGPAVSDALDIPYIQIESTRARKRLSGPWAEFARAAEHAADHAAVIFYMTQTDLEALEAYRVSEQNLVHLRPFLSRDALPEMSDPKPGHLLAAGMMRAGDKLASYRALAAALAQVELPYSLEIAGDGPARAEVEALLPQAQFLGHLDAVGMARAYRRAQALVWPGVNEAYGMVYLEAQAHGVAVVAEDRPGLRDVVRDGLLSVAQDSTALAENITRILSNPEVARNLGEAGRKRVGDDHLLGSASATLWAALERFL